MGDTGHGVGLHGRNGIPEESVTGLGGPVLLASSAPELGRGDVLAGRYQIEAVIGTGGSGRVLRAFDRVARAAVALKILRPEYVSDPVWTERFSRELRVGRQIQHRNVCRVFDIGDAEGQRFLSMELATRGTIRGQIGTAALERSLEDRLADARAVVEGAAALHAAGIIHRDLKPENILRMEDGRLVVSDFGLATDPGAGPATTIMVGTPRYMAPEVVMGDPATARADVWALGIVLHEILFGVRPDRSVIRRGARLYTPPPLATLKERRLAQLCARCAEEDPRSRPASAGEVRREFEAAVLGRRSRHGADRRQVVWGAVAIAALAGLGVVRDRWASRAVASSSQVARVIGGAVLQPTGTPENWSTGARSLATFPGPMHCFSWSHDRRSVRAIWGEPRRAEDIDVASQVRTPSRLLRETYENGCPQTSPDGTSVLFTKTTPKGGYVFLSRSPDGRGAAELVRGLAPEWLPNGREFAIELDFRHAAIFSIPTGDLTVIGDGLTASRQLAEKAVDQSGNFVAIRYFTDTVDNLVVVQELPTLNLVGQFRMPTSAQSMRFVPSSHTLRFSVNGPRSVSELVAVDWAQASLKRMGAMADSDVIGTIDGGGALQLIASRQVRHDLWWEGPASATSARLTHDGASNSGSRSSRGDLAIQRRLPDGRYVIVLRRADGSETQVTEGPMDMTPSFLPDGTRWIHASYSIQALVECRVSDLKCVPILSDSMTPVFPSVDPEGKQVAYLTFMNTPRLHLLSFKAGTKKDLGTVAAECAPFWASPSRLWVAQTTGNRLSWAELNATTGERTANVYSATKTTDRRCALPDAITRGEARTSGMVYVHVEETSRLALRGSIEP